MDSNKAKLIAKLGLGAVALAVPVVMMYEGLITRTYRDPIGILTASYGHTGPELRSNPHRAGSADASRLPSLSSFSQPSKP